MFLNAHPKDGRTKIKICGVTRVQDALFAAEAGAHAIGLVFAESPRRIDPDTAQQIVRQLPDTTTPVAVVVNPNQDEVRQLCQTTGIRTVQFHGDESAAFLRTFTEIQAIKAIRIAGPADVDKMREFSDYPIVCDTMAPGGYGGTGTTFDHRLVKDCAKHRTLILSGGLAPRNVQDAIALVHPFAVDTSSGVESAPGVKDHAKISAFIRAVHRASPQA